MEAEIGGPMMIAWAAEAERQRGNTNVASELRKQANQPEYLAMQAQMINYELAEMRTQIQFAGEAHAKNKPYSPPRQLATQVVRFILGMLDGSARTGMIVTLSQAPQNGWETWFS